MRGFSSWIFNCSFTHTNGYLERFMRNLHEVEAIACVCVAVTGLAFTASPDGTRPYELSNFEGRALRN